MGLNVSCLPKQDCCGCGACAQSCPKKCIKMELSSEGFLYPTVDDDKCVGCGVCSARCPIINRKERSEKDNLPQPATKALIVQDKDESSLMRSTSGGAFGFLARQIIAEGGVVFGAAYDEQLNVRHIAVESTSDLHRLQGSKYVVSHLGDSYAQVKKLLSENRKVLFSGTACQVAGLKTFLGRDSDLLITMDIVCHGTPSQKLFKKYIEWLGEKNGAPVEWYDFRTKRLGGWTHVGAYGVNGKTKIVNPYCDPYYAAFLRGEICRTSCYTCPFSNLSRPADFTAGDFWGFYNLKQKIDFDHKKGVSLLLVNTAKAETLLADLESVANVVSVDVESARSGNANLYHPTKFNPIRDEIYSRIDEPFEVLQKKYLYHEGKIGFYIRRLRRRLLSQKTRDALKKLLGR